MKTERIKVQKGENIQTAWERLVRWVDTLKVVPGEGVRVRETPKGTIVTITNKRKTHTHPFKVSASGLLITVKEGTVNTMSPTLYDQKEKSWLPIATSGTDNQPPVMELDVNKITGNQFYINLRVVVDEIGNIVDNEENLRIVQTEVDSGDGDEAHYFPIAVGYLNADRTGVSEMFQVVHHNLNYIFQDGDGIDRLLFYAT